MFGVFCPHLLLLDEVHEVGPLDLHRLTLPVVQRQDEVEEVGLAQVGGRLLLEVRPGQTHSAADTQAEDESVLEANVVGGETSLQEQRNMSSKSFIIVTIIIIIFLI